jgi:predicted amidohydrolase
MRAAAVQLEPRIADVAANLEACERLAGEAARAGAEWIALPEFFTTGIAFDPALAHAAVAPDGPAADMMRAVATRHGVTVGGSFLCRDADGEARNAYLLVEPDGTVAGRHDKDLPTMWENSFYVGGNDDGVIRSQGLTVGAAVCWELVRTQTARRLRGRVDLVMAGSGWWSVPPWPPAAVTRRLEARNRRLATTVAQRFGPYVGAPVVHAAHAGAIDCATPGVPGLRYRGHLEGGATISDAHGRVLARRTRREGAGFVVADVEPGRTAPAQEVPDRFWLHRRQVLSAAFWNLQRLHGRRWYARHTRGRPPLELQARASARQAFWPPNPKELESASSRPGASRGPSGTQSTSHSGSGSS